LTAQGWRVLVLWECELKNDEELHKGIRNFLGPNNLSKPTRTP
jgi:G:T-mismatch repair DNA endonuclease (very short patch repair protein)